MQFDVPKDYTQNPQEMPRPYVSFEMRPVESRDASGAVSYSDVPWVKVVPPGSRDVLEKVASDWISGLKAHADAGRIPPYWPSEYEKALAAFKVGEELPPVGTPIKSWPPLSPAQRKAVLGANVLTVEDLALSNDEMKTRIGMGAETLVQIAKKWVEDAKGPGALASKLQDEIIKNEENSRLIADLRKTVTELEARLPKAVPA